MRFSIKELILLFAIFFALFPDYTKDIPDKEDAMTQILQTEASSSQLYKSNIFATAKLVNLTVQNEGQWIEEKDSQFITWTHTIKEEASSLNFGFSEFVLPASATLTICDELELNCQEFSALKNNKHHLQLWTPILKGGIAKFSLRLLKSEKSSLKLRLTSINKGLPKNINRQSSQECLIDVLCTEEFPQINDFTAEIQSVGLISIEGTRLCSGVLLNNAREDYSPYFLTARHCGINAENAASVVVHWNYENTTCRFGNENNKIEGDGSLAQFNSGAQFLSGLQRSDFTLLLLDGDIDEEVNAFYAGWDSRSASPVNVTTIHHANTEEKRITFGAGKTTITRHFGEEVDPDLNHIRIPQWDVSSTSGGSSGCPLFDINHRVVGQLHGGLAACGNNKPDWFGRLHTSWLGDEVPERQLKHWLDPEDTGIEFMDGIWDELNPLAIQIAGNQTSIIACNGDNTGAILVDIFNGVGPYEYSIDGGENFQSQALFQNLPAGEYLIVVRDANQSSSEPVPFLVTEPAELTIASQQDFNQLTLSIDGGKPPYLVTLNGQISFDTVYSNLPVGAQNFMVTDANGCVRFLELDLMYNPFQAIADITSPITCFDSTDGRISISHSGTAEPYQYKLNNGNYTESNVFENLLPGTYIGSVKDRLGNTVSTQIIELEMPEELFVSLNSIEENIVVEVTGGIPPYLYQYDNAAPNSENSFLIGSGIEEITVTDRNGCAIMINNSFVSSTLNHSDLLISYYPNPVSNQLYLDVGDQVIEAIEIVNTKGMRINPGNISYPIIGTRKINVNDLSSGIYFLNLREASGASKTLKFSVLRQ